jgi:hypothetical protein
MYRILWFIDEHRRGVLTTVVAVILAGVLVVWLSSSKGGQTKEAHRMQAGLLTAQELTSHGQYCQAFDILGTLPRSDDTNLTQTTAAQQPHLLLGCQIQRELSTVDELGTSPDITRLQAAQQLVQHLLTKADAYPPLYRTLLEKHQQIAQRIAAEQQTQWHTAFSNHLQKRQWREAEALLRQLPGAMRDTYADLLERSRRHDAWLEQSRVARGEHRFEDAMKVLQQIVQEGESPFVETAATAFSDIQAKLAAELQAFRTHQFPYKRTRTDVNFRTGPSASSASYFAIPSGTVVALLDEVQKPGDTRPWARVRLTVPKPGHEDQLVGFIRSNLLIDYR